MDAMRQNPRDWRISDVAALCAAHQVACTAPKKGSHYKVKHPSQAKILTIPAHRPIKAIYIEELVRFVDAVREISQ